MIELIIDYNSALDALRGLTAARVRSNCDGVSSNRTRRFRILRSTCGHNDKARDVVASVVPAVQNVIYGHHICWVLQQSG
jgi:hypothetical protein